MFLNCEPDEAGDAVHFEFTHNTRSISIHGFWAYRQQFSDVFWALSICQERKNFILALAQERQ